MRRICDRNKKLGFTLIELLVVISIIVIITSLSLFGIQNVRKSARDAKRKSDLETIRGALEMYKSDCYSYPDSPGDGNSLTGDSDLGFDACLDTNVYLQTWPFDTLSGRNYSYSHTSNTYTLCAALESDTSGDGSGCGSCSSDVSCNYKVTNP